MAPAPHCPPQQQHLNTHRIHQGGWQGRQAQDSATAHPATGEGPLAYQITALLLKTPSRELASVSFKCFSMACTVCAMPHSCSTLAYVVNGIRDAVHIPTSLMRDLTLTASEFSCHKACKHPCRHQQAISRRTKAMRAIRCLFLLLWKHTLTRYCTSGTL